MDIKAIILQRIGVFIVNENDMTGDIAYIISRKYLG
jgi:hypothetical protein